MKKYYTLVLLFSCACIHAQVEKSWEKVYTDFNPRNAKVNTDIKGNIQWLQATNASVHFRLMQIIQPETINNNQLATIFNAVIIEITGDIEDYQDNQTIYKVELWKRN
jgi:hypothetical protein